MWSANVLSVEHMPFPVSFTSNRKQWGHRTVPLACLGAPDLTTVLRLCFPSRSTCWVLFVNQDCIHAWGREYHKSSTSKVGDCVQPKALVKSRRSMTSWFRCLLQWLQVSACFRDHKRLGTRITSPWGLTLQFVQSWTK